MFEFWYFVQHKSQYVVVQIELRCEDNIFETISMPSWGLNEMIAGVISQCGARIRCRK